MKKNFLAQAESLLGHFKPIDIDCVHELMGKLYHGDTIINNEFSMPTTVDQIFKETTWNMPATKIKITFYGGPLSRGKWHKGTLLSYLLDCIAARIQTDGFTKTRMALGVGKRRMGGVIHAS
jgi:hypothetical protein